MNFWGIPVFPGAFWRLPGKPVACLSLGIVGLSPNISSSQDLGLFFQFLTKGLLGMSLFGVGAGYRALEEQCLQRRAKSRLGWLPKEDFIL